MHPPYAHPAALPPEKLLDECAIQFVRRSGPGGQHRNKVSTAVVLTHRPTGITAEASERRSQAENRAAALRRLRVNLALEIRCPHPRPLSQRERGVDDSPHPQPLSQREREVDSCPHPQPLSQRERGVDVGRPPSTLWRSRCRGGRIELSAEHADFPALLAEALDALAAAGFEPRTAAEPLGCSASQLVKLLKKEPRALAGLNEQRRQRNLHRIQ